MAPAAGAETRTGSWGSGGTLTPGASPLGPLPGNSNAPREWGGGPHAAGRGLRPLPERRPHAHTPPRPTASAAGGRPGSPGARPHRRGSTRAAVTHAAGRHVRGRRLRGRHCRGGDDGTAGRRRGPTLPASLPPTVRYSREITAQRVG